MITVIVASTALSALCSALFVRRSRRRDAQQLTDRLIATQESERSRLARDLHDNLSQRLALLCFDLQHLDARPPLSPAEIAASVTELLDSATDIANEVRCLSHDLHPPTLHPLGLAPAIESLCRQVSRQGHLQIEFRHRGVSHPIPPATALCLFRIAQEALHNVVKHSGSTAVVVRLVGTARNVRLDVADGGKGFNQASPSGRGLGLVSMRERAQLAGGLVGIRTAINKGTRIVVTLPLRGEPARRSSGDAPAGTASRRFRLMTGLT